MNRFNGLAISDCKMLYVAIEDCNANKKWKNKK